MEALHPICGAPERLTLDLSGLFGLFCWTLVSNLRVLALFSSRWYWVKGANMFTMSAVCGGCQVENMAI